MKKALTTVALLAVMGLAVSQASAAVMFSFMLIPADGQSTTLTPDSPSVTFDCYIYFAGSDGNYKNDGLVYFNGGFKSSTGGLKGDMLFAPTDAGGDALSTYRSSKVVTQTSQKNCSLYTFDGYQDGSVQDLDGDGDADIGGKDGNLMDGWLNMGPANGYFAQCDQKASAVPNCDGNRLWVGQLTFTVTDTGQAPNTTTDVQWILRTDPGAVHQAFVVDTKSSGYTIQGNNSMIGTPSVTITYVPEPGTIALLVMGGLALIVRRKRVA